MLTSTRPLTRKTIEDFGRRLRGLAHGLWAGDIGIFDWSDSMAMAIYRGYEQAWTEGAARVGILPEDRTPEETLKLQSTINEDLARIVGLGDFIEENTQADNIPYGTVVSRVELWVNRYTSVANDAAVTAGADRKFIWEYGATSDHCGDCAKYEGKIHRGSLWVQVGALPQGRTLECGGWRCDCRLVPTDAPATPGIPPAPSGG